MKKSIQEDVIEVYTRAELFASTLWLHGLGVNASDMDAVITSMRKSRELGLHHVAPNAPLRPITVNNGYPTRAWFDVLGDPAEAGEDQEGIEASGKRIQALLDTEQERGITSEHIILGGFSQGASMALHAGLRYPRRLGGIVMLSGEAVLMDQLIKERHPANFETPILMIHGSEDATIPVEDARRSRDALQKLGYPVDWHEFPVAHVLCAEEIALLDEWAYQILEPAITRG